VPVATVAGPIALQVAAVSRLDRAQSLVEDLRSRGYDAWVLQPPAEEPASFYRVRVGVFASAADAQGGAAALAEETGLSPVIADAPGGTATPFRVQVAAIRDGDAARALAARLASAGHPAYVLSPRTGGDGLFRVRAGEFATREVADARNQADHAVYQIGRQLEEHGSKLSDDERAGVLFLSATALGGVR